MNKIGNVGAIQIANMISENSTIIELDLGNIMNLILFRE